MEVNIQHRYANNPDMIKPTEEANTARKRMALFPKNSEIIFPRADFWVPTVRLQKKLYILPGVPRVIRLDYLIGMIV